jgi:phage/plasmid primase-like uncharacterized protein
MITEQCPSVQDLAAALKLNKTQHNFEGSCPSCDYHTGFSLTEKQGTILMTCHAGGCAFKEITAALKARGLWGNRTKDNPIVPIQQVLGESNRQVSSATALKMFKSSQPAAGTVVETYLCSRGIDGAMPQSVRFIPNAIHTPSGERFPVMLAAVTGPDGHNVVAVHRTFLKPDGSGKADVTPAKMSLGPLKGNAVHLGVPDDTLLVAEGIETALSVQQVYGVPAWAALSATGMQNLVLPERVKLVIICADNDGHGVGNRAAEHAAKNWAGEGRAVKITTPPQVDMDFNDVLMAKGA